MIRLQQIFINNMKHLFRLARNTQKMINNFCNCNITKGIQYSIKIKDISLPRSFWEQICQIISHILSKITKNFKLDWNKHKKKQMKEIRKKFRNFQCLSQLGTSAKFVNNNMKIILSIQNHKSILNCFVKVKAGNM